MHICKKVKKNLRFFFQLLAHIKKILYFCSRKSCYNHKKLMTMAKREQKQEEQKPKRINPIMEYLAPLRGTLIINDPALL